MDPDHPTRRLGQPVFPPTCSVLGERNATTDVYLIIADRAFSDLQPDQVQPGGLTDENHWELQCL
jgi:hypothetical protein